MNYNWFLYIFWNTGLIIPSVTVLLLLLLFSLFNVKLLQSILRYIDAHLCNFCRTFHLGKKGYTYFYIQGYNTVWYNSKISCQLKVKDGGDAYFSCLLITDSDDFNITYPVFPMWTCSRCGLMRLATGFGLRGKKDLSQDNKEFIWNLFNWS